MNTLTRIRAIQNQRSEEGFTLIELMIVMVIIGVLAGIAIPIFSGQQKAAIAAGVQADVRNTGGSISSQLPKNPTTKNVASLVGLLDGVTVKTAAMPADLPLSDPNTEMTVSGTWDAWTVLAHNEPANATYCWNSDYGKLQSGVGCKYYAGYPTDDEDNEVPPVVVPPVVVPPVVVPPVTGGGNTGNTPTLNLYASCRSNAYLPAPGATQLANDGSDRAAEEATMNDIGMTRADYDKVIEFVCSEADSAATRFKNGQFDSEPQYGSIQTQAGSKETMTFVQDNSYMVYVAIHSADTYGEDGRIVVEWVDYNGNKFPTPTFDTRGRSTDGW
jgi:prepilin-type N-terminal cleavage/methylation domain-containing protein